MGCIDEHLHAKPRHGPERLVRLTCGDLYGRRARRRRVMRHIRRRFLDARVALAVAALSLIVSTTAFALVLVGLACGAD